MVLRSLVCWIRLCYIHDVKHNSAHRSSAFGIVIFMMAICAWLAEPSHVFAAVYSPQQALPPQTVEEFVADPAALLRRHPEGGPIMIKVVRDLAASDPSTLNALVGLLASANPEQAAAIATALAQVALMAVQNDQPYSTAIQTAVVAAGNNDALVAYMAIVGGNATGAGGGGEGGGGGGGGGESANAITATETPQILFDGRISSFSPSNVTAPTSLFTLSFTASIGNTPTGISGPNLSPVSRSVSPH